MKTYSILIGDRHLFASLIGMSLIVLEPAVESFNHPRTVRVQDPIRIVITDGKQ